MSNHICGSVSPMSCQGWEFFWGYEGETSGEGNWGLGAIDVKTRTIRKRKTLTVCQDNNNKKTKNSYSTSALVCYTFDNSDLKNCTVLWILLIGLTRQ